MYQFILLLAAGLGLAACAGAPPPPTYKDDSRGLRPINQDHLTVTENKVISSNKKIKN
jgi:hypothetical protein